MPNSSALIREIRAALEHDPRINVHRDTITLDNSNGALRISGEVGSIAAKTLIVAHARAHNGIYNTIDQLRVTPATLAGDGAIRDALCRNLLREPTLLGISIGMRAKQQTIYLRRTDADFPGEVVIDVDNAVVALSGQVTSLSHKRLCGVFAWWTPGCCNVANHLEVVPLEYDNDDEIADALGLVLEIDPLVHSGQLSYTVRNSVVTLRGHLTTQEERRMAETDTWYIDGVTDVINHITVRH